MIKGTTNYSFDNVSDLYAAINLVAENDKYTLGFTNDIKLSQGTMVDNSKECLLYVDKKVVNSSINKSTEADAIVAITREILKSDVKPKNSEQFAKNIEILKNRYLDSFKYTDLEFLNNIIFFFLSNEDVLENYDNLYKKFSNPS